MRLTIQLGERIHAVVERGSSIEGTGGSSGHNMLERLMTDGQFA